MKEPSILPDVQLERDTRGIELQAVGVSELLVPLRILRHEDVVTVPARASLSVSLCPDLKGIHMSRLVEVLVETSREPLRNLSLEVLLKEAMARLHSSSAAGSVRFSHFIEKEAPVSKARAPMSYEWELSGSVREEQEGRCSFEQIFGLEIPFSNLCPCSKAIARYGAHNQRGLLKVRLRMNPAAVYSVEWLEKLTLQLESAGSYPVFPLLKRVDEKAVTERQYDNPKFVEDVVRDAVTALESEPLILGYELKAEAFESIHAHNAWAAARSNFGS